MALKATSFSSYFSCLAGQHFIEFRIENRHLKWFAKLIPVYLCSYILTIIFYALIKQYRLFLILL